MRNWIKFALVGIVLSGAIGCGNPGMPNIRRGMTTDQASRELANRYPPVIPVAVRVTSDGQYRNVFLQQDTYSNLYITVDSHNGIVTRADYTLLGR